MKLANLGWAILLAPYCGTNLAHAEDYKYNTPIYQKVYEGTLGNQKIVLQVLNATQNGKKFNSASYFYASQRLEIQLGHADNAINNYEEYAPCSDDVEECPLKAKIKLVPDGDNLKGSWTAVKGGKSYAITLSKIADAVFTEHYEISYDIDIMSDTNEGADDISKNIFKRKISLGETLYSKEQFLNGFGYKTATDKKSGIHYITLSSAPNGQNLDKINAALTNMRLTLVNYGLTCAAGRDKGAVYGTYGDWDSYDSKPVNINERILVIEEEGSTDCGGAHPNNSYSHNIFDMKSGNIIEGKNLFKLYNEKDYQQIKTPEFQKILAKLDANPKTHLPQDADNKELTEQCLPDSNNEENNDTWMPYSAYPAKDGVVFALENVPHVMSGCMGDYYEIPYKEALPLMTPLAKQIFAKELGTK